MEIWFNESRRIIRGVLAWGGTGAPWELAIMAMLAFAVGALVLDRASRAMASPIHSTGRALGVLLLGFAFAVAAVAAVNLHLLASIADPGLRHALPAAAAVLSAMIFAVPLLCLVHRMNYFQAFFALVLAVLTAAAVSWMIHAAISALTEGDVEFEKTRKRTEDLNEVMRRK